MTAIRTPVETEVGILQGRDAIYLDELAHRDSPSTIEVRGDFNVELCSNLSSEAGDWISYRLTFRKVLAFRGWEIDSYPSPLEIVSSIDRVPGSLWAEELKASKATHFVLSTYDFIFEFLAQSFELKTGEPRKAER